LKRKITIHTQASWLYSEFQTDRTEMVSSLEGYAGLYKTYVYVTILSLPV